MSNTEKVKAGDLKAGDLFTCTDLGLDGQELEFEYYYFLSKKLCYYNSEEEVVHIYLPHGNKRFSRELDDEGKPKKSPRHTKMIQDRVSQALESVRIEKVLKAQVEGDYASTYALFVADDLSGFKKEEATWVSYNSKPMYQITYSNPKVGYKVRFDTCINNEKIGSQIVIETENSYYPLGIANSDGDIDYELLKRAWAYLSYAYKELRNV